LNGGAKFPQKFLTGTRREDFFAFAGSGAVRMLFDEQHFISAGRAV
jgi:hypothetical protein